MKTVFSGMQPTGELHFGNYVGAARNWVELQNGGQYSCIYCIVDYHAITQDYEPREMSRRVFEMAVDFLACGVDPERSLLFVQSAVPEHTELCWVLSAVSPFGDLSRMTQFKDKSRRQADNINVGLFEYPVLQTADIILYKASLVPVGQDQVQHVEFARRIARAFNRRWGELFPEPEPLLTSTPKLLGLDGKAKMSKSMGNSLMLTAEDSVIRKKLSRAATDPQRERREDPGDPEVCNIYTLHKVFSDAERCAWVREGCTSAGIGCSDCKRALADNVIEHVRPIRERKQELVAHPERVREILAAGAERASKIAKSTMAEVREKLGLWK